MHPLLAEPSAEQRSLLEVIYEGRTLAGRPPFTRARNRGTVQRAGKPSLWPPFQYVESTLYTRQRLDARGVLATCPEIPSPGGRYGWVDYETLNPLNIRPGTRLTLTVAGMMHVEAARDEAEVFLDMLALMVDEERTFPPSPVEAQDVTLTVGTVQSRLAETANGWSLSQVALDALRDALRHEPGTRPCTATTDSPWTITLSAFLRDYEGLATPGEYVQRVIDLNKPVPTEREPLYPSALSLPEAIDYLNAVWRLHAGNPLVRIGRAEAAAKLVLDCANADEFESRLSALCSIFEVLDLPDDREGKLWDLREYLGSKLPEESRTRAGEAIDDLRALFDLRVGRQHAGTEARAARGMRRLGLSLPVIDWGVAWQHIQTRTVSALSALREEIERLSPS